MADGGGSDSDDNPFSFKKFVQTKGEGKSNPSGSRRQESRNSENRNLPDVSDVGRKKESEKFGVLTFANE